MSARNLQPQYLCRMRHHQGTQTSLPSLPLLIISAILSSFIVRQGAEVNAFVQTTSISRLKFSSNKDILANNDVISNQRMPSALSMVTKSGGRLIASIEQFDREVLKNDSSEEEEPPLDPNLPVLVLFSAPWCGPCRLTNPVVKEIMKQYQNKIEVVEISTDDLPEVASDAGVLSIPTIQLYYEGKVLDTIVGCVAKNVLAKSVDKVLEDLGMLEEQV